MYSSEQNIYLMLTKIIVCLGIGNNFMLVRVYTLVIVIMLGFLASSCSRKLLIVKRQYSKGYYVHVSSNKDAPVLTHKMSKRSNIQLCKYEPSSSLPAIECKEQLLVTCHNGSVPPKNIRTYIPVHFSTVDKHGISRNKETFHSNENKKRKKVNAHSSPLMQTDYLSLLFRGAMFVAIAMILLLIYVNLYETEALLIIAAILMGAGFGFLLVAFILLNPWFVKLMEWLWFILRVFFELFFITLTSSIH